MDTPSFDNLETISTNINVSSLLPEPVINPDSKIITITNEFLESGMTSNVGINNSQLTLLGIPTPPESGWKEKVIGKTISKNDAEVFLSLKGLKGKKAKNILEEYLNKKVENDELTQEEKSQIEQLKRDKRKGKSVKELSWNNITKDFPFNKQLCAFITEIGLPRCGYFDANTGYFIIEDKDGKKYPFKNIKYWYPLPLITKKKEYGILKYFQFMIY